MAEVQEQTEMTKLQKALYDYAITIILLLSATAINYLTILYYDNAVNVSGIYLLAVILISLLTGSYVWGIISALCSVVGTNFCFTYPYFAIDFSVSGYPFTFFIMGAVALGSCALTVNMRKQRDQAHQREKMTQVINEVDQRLLQVECKKDIVALLLECLYTQLECPILYMELQGDKLVCQGHNGNIPEQLESLHYDIALQSIEQRRIVGRGIDEENDKGFLSIPVMWQERTLGAVCVLLYERILSPDVRAFAQGLVNHFAIAFERQELSETQQRILMEKQAEQTRGYLLRAISHDLRTPLTGILGASGSILENGERMQSDLKNRLIQDIHEEARWLLRMIENVLSVTKIGNYNPELKKSMEPVEEVVADSVVKCKKYFPDLKIMLCLPEELIMLPMDPVLIRQVLINLIDNAYRHGNSRKNIELMVEKKDDFVEFSVQDYGAGMATEDLTKVFSGMGLQKRKDGDSSRGLGLGMSICKIIIEAHSGQIFAENTAGKGLRVAFRLPMEEKKA